MIDYEENSNKSLDIEDMVQYDEKISKNTREEDKENNIKIKNVIDDYEIKETIGKGTFSTVKLGEDKKTKQKVAIKILNKQKIKAKDELVRIKREIKILSMMDHPNIIKTYNISENEKFYYIIMEYCNGGELFNYIVDKEKLDENEASMFFFQLINALEYIHSLGIAHRDLKPENLLLLDNKIIKIIDFGLSNYFNGEKNLETPCGSPSYASPEIIKGEAYNGFCIDIWASGIILFAMLCGYLPFDDDEEEEEENEDESKEDIINSVKKGNNHNNKSISENSDEEESSSSDDNEILFERILEGKLDYPSYLSEAAIDLMKKILVVEPQKRIQIKDIKKHKFYLLGQKNFLLNQKNISKTSKKLLKIENKIEKSDIKSINNKIIHDTKNNYIINHGVNNNYNIKDNSLNEVNQEEINAIKIKNDNIKNKILNEENGKIKNNNKEMIKEEMEKYEKKLFENYLKNVITVKKQNSILNKRKKQINKRNKLNKNKIYLKKLNTINANPIHSLINKDIKKNLKKKSNHTLNEIILNFNPYNIKYRQIIDSPLFLNKNHNKVHLSKITPIVRKNYDYSINLNKNNNNFHHQENSKILNKDNTILLSINIPDLKLRQKNHTENKLLSNIKYCITNDNLKKKEETIKNKLYHQKLNSIDHIKDISSVKSSKPFLPLIKNSLFNIFSNNSINQSKDFPFLSPTMHLNTEAANGHRRSKKLFNVNKNNVNEFLIHSNNLIKNGFKYKLFHQNIQKYNISTSKNIY